MISKPWPGPCLFSHHPIFSRSEMAARIGRLPWPCSGRERAWASRATRQIRRARSSSRRKAAMRPCPRPVGARTPSSNTFAIASVTFRSSVFFQVTDSSIFMRRSRRSIICPRPEGARRTSPRARSRAVVPYAARRSIYSARCWDPSREMSPSLLPRRAASLSPVELRRELLNI